MMRGEAATSVTHVSLCIIAYHKIRLLLLSLPLLPKALLHSQEYNHRYPRSTVNHLRTPEIPVILAAEDSLCSFHAPGTCTTAQVGWCSFLLSA